MGNVDGCQQPNRFLQVASSSQIANLHKELQMISANYGVGFVFQMENSVLKNRLALHSKLKNLVNLAMTVNVFGSLQLKSQMLFAEYKSAQMLLQTLLLMKDV